MNTCNTNSQSSSLPSSVPSIPAKYKGILFIILSSLSFAVMNLFVRLAGDLPSFQKSFFRNLVSLAFAYLIIRKSGEKISYKKENIPLLILRSAFGTLGILCNFYAVDHLALADASMLNKLSPFFTLIFSFLILKENLKLYQVLALVSAFVGTLFVVKPTGVNLNLVPALIGLTGGMSAGLAYTIVRKLGLRGEKGPFIVFFFSGFSCLVLLPLLLLSYQPMTLRQLLMLLGAGLGAAGGQFGITAAYFHAPAKEISVYDYSQIPFAALLGFLFFGQIPDGSSFLGYFIIIATAIAMFFRSKK
ncbi:MAG: DMT family transporter [Lachnospiraceae bacterium]|nr:DMT family transporter [Lachnospiraceae bacterium]